MFRFDPRNFDENTNNVFSSLSHSARGESVFAKRLNAAVTRAIDIIISLTALIALLPLFFVVVVLIKRESSGPVFYRQTRNGLNSKTFSILKFRSMQDQKESTFAQCVADDSRVTKFGRTLRKTSIDELPQLWNILIGDMSIVGPRPHAVEHDVQFAKVLPRYFERYSVKPGLTGLAQVRGLRGPTPTLKSMADRLAADIEYSKRKSVMLDLQIILQTLPLVISAHNAH